MLVLFILRCTAGKLVDENIEAATNKITAVRHSDFYDLPSSVTPASAIKGSDVVLEAE